MEGWIKLWRELLNKPIWKQSTPEQKAILITLLLMANHAPNEWEWKGEKFMTEPGQFVTSLKSIKANAGKGISIKNVRTALVRFEKLEFLANKGTKMGRLITITNWGDYQPKPGEGGKDAGKGVAKTGQRGGKEVAPNKNERIKEGKNDKKKEEDNSDLIPGPDFPSWIFELMKPEGFKKGRYEWVLKQDPDLVEAAYYKMHELDKDFQDINSRHAYFVDQLKKLIDERKGKCLTRK